MGGGAGVGVAVGGGVGVLVGTTVGVGVLVGVFVGAGVGVLVGGTVAVRVAVGVEVGAGPTATAYADMGALKYVPPTLQVPGRLFRLVCELVCDLPPVAMSRKWTVPLPLGPRTAIQYFVPALMLAAGRVTLFQAPATGVVRVAWLNSAPALPPLSVYRPATTWLAALLGSR